jgi:hypothetical protein
MRGLHFKLRLPLALLAAILSTQTAMSGEQWSAGISGGAALTDLMGRISGYRMSGYSEAKRYTVGPVLEIRLPASFAAEFSALYRRAGFTFQYMASIQNVTSRVRANSWEFPMIFKYYMGGRNAVARPYVSGGYVLRFLSNAQQARYTSPLPGFPPPPIYHGAYWLDSNPSQGMAIGGGLSLKAGPIHIAPEIRYTGWFTVPFDTYGSHGFTVQSARDQVDLLVAVTF